MMGVFAYWNLHYAYKNNLVKKQFHINRVNALKREILADPIVAIICIPLAFVSLEIWIIAMVVLIPVTNVIMFRISKKRRHI